MSLSSQVTRTFGSVQVFTNSEFKVGSSSSVNISSSPVAAVLSTTATTVTASQLLSRIITQTPSSALTITLPSYAALTAAYPNSDNIQVGDSFPFSLINLSGTSAITVAAGTNGTLVGSGVTAITSTSNFLVQVTVVGGSPAYVVYRL